MASPQPPRSRIRRVMRGMLVNPLATLLLAGVLVWSATSLTGPGAPRSDAGNVIREIIGGARPTGPRLILLYVIRETDQLRVIDAERESWDELSDLVEQRPRDVLLVNYLAGRERVGFWAPTRDRTHRSFTVEPLAGELSPDEAARARAAAADYLAESEGLDAGAAVETGFYERSRIIWSGYAHNTGALAAFIALVYSLGWIPAAVRTARERRRARAIAQGRCPNCGYSVAGLSSSTCPECGAETGLPLTPG